jgi:D-amino-acid dehydrogenase
MRIAILGGGVIGLMTAWFARRRGLDVVVIDRGEPLRNGCSFGNAGMIVPSHFIPLAAPGMVELGLKWMWNPESPFYIRPRLSWDLVTWAARFWQAATAAHVARSGPVLRDLHLRSRTIYADLARNWANDFGLAEEGLLMLCKTQAALDDEAHVAESASRLGLPANILDRDALRSLDPDITMDVAGGVFFPKDCHLSPNRLMSGLQQRLAADGVEFLFGREITGFQTQSGRIVSAEVAVAEVAAADLATTAVANRTPQTEVIAADQFVLCGGVWSTRLGQLLRLSIPMQAGKGYSLTLNQPRQLPRLCSILTEARVAVTPMGGSLRVGGTMELAGIDHRVDPRRVRGIVRSIPQYFPEFRESDFDGIKPWHGLRPCSPDGLPYIGRPRGWDNLVVATGHAMMGLSLAPVSGEVAVDLLTGAPPSVAIDSLSPDRYRR